jgi:glycosyltransferase involved in cell wall biosynthesis
MLISIIHPSLGRPVQARKCYDHWIKTCSEDHEIEWIVSLNSNDAEIENYHQCFIGADAVLMETNSKNMVQATNEAAKVCSGDLLILVSDDMFSPEMWDSRILNKYEIIDGPGILQVYDGITSQKLTIPIMNRLAYIKLGYMYHPEYISMYADDDLRKTALKHGMLYNATDIFIEHRHFMNGKANYDKTYALENSQKAMAHGQKLYYERAKLNFPI